MNSKYSYFRIVVFNIFNRRISLLNKADVCFFSEIVLFNICNVCHLCYYKKKIFKKSKFTNTEQLNQKK